MVQACLGGVCHCSSAVRLSREEEVYVGEAAVDLETPVCSPMLQAHPRGR